MHQVADGQGVVAMGRVERDQCHVFDDLELNGHGLTPALRWSLDGHAGGRPALAAGGTCFFVRCGDAGALCQASLAYASQ
ncbi:hypothetical protein D3C81_1891670 [compost metagenome]